LRRTPRRAVRRLRSAEYQCQIACWPIALEFDAEEKESTRADSADIKEQRSCGAIPLTVLTAADELPGSPFPPAENRAIERAWTAGHDRLARLSSAGVHSVIPHYGHFIQLYQPAAVISAVAEVVNQAKRVSQGR
jgi:pimeloyl-ACP methyl ester carboxylesterase